MECWISVAGLDHTKFGFYQFQRDLYIVTFSQISIHSQLLWKFYSNRTRKKTLLRRLKNIGTASEKLYRNTLSVVKNGFRFCSFLLRTSSDSCVRETSRLNWFVFIDGDGNICLLSGKRRPGSKRHPRPKTTYIGN